jgi:hypothetical protein
LGIRDAQDKWVTRFRFGGAGFTTKISVSTLAGAMGELYKARTMRLEQMVAIKGRVLAAGIRV